MSHDGGWYDGHYDTALALGHAGFVVAAVSHTGDTFNDQSRVLQLWHRSTQLHWLVDYMLDEWPSHARLDAARVGAFRFFNVAFGRCDRKRSSLRPIAYRASRRFGSAPLWRRPPSGRWPNAKMICGNNEAQAKRSPTPHTPGQCHTLHA